MFEVDNILVNDQPKYLSHESSNNCVSWMPKLKFLKKKKKSASWNATISPSLFLLENAKKKLSQFVYCFLKNVQTVYKPKYFNCLLMILNFLMSIFNT